MLAAAGAHAQTTTKEVVVTAASRKEVEARIQQFEAPNLVNIQPAETILKYPDFNAAEALGRVPGISISTDTGEGRFVNIRGIDGNLAGATFSGVPLLNTFPGGTYFGGGGRAVEFDTIPTGSIDGIIVTKTTLPDHEAEGLGGSVELTPRTAKTVVAPFAEATLGYGYEPMHDHPGPLSGELVVGGRFGLDGSHLAIGGQSEPARAGFFSNPTPFSLVLTASWRADRRGFDDIEEDYFDTTVDRSYQDIQMRHYDYHRRRFGYGGEFDFQPNDDHSWYLRGNVAGYTESVQKNRLTYDDLNDTVDPSNPNGFATPTDITLASTDEQETHRNQVYVAGGEDHFGRATLDYRASFSRATYSQSKNFGAKFKGPQGLSFSYDNSANNGDFPVLNADTTLINDPNQYSPIKKVSNSTEYDRDQEWAYAANFQFPIHLLGDDDRIKIGGQARLRDKVSNPYAYTYDISPLSLASASGAAITNFYYHYTNGPYINVGAVRSAALAGTLEDGSGLDTTAFFTAHEDIYAGYAQYQGELGPFGILAGVRVEATRANYGGFNDNNPDQTPVLQNRQVDYTNAFPTVQLRYRINPDMQVRATWSTGIGRPGFLQNANVVVSNHDPTSPQVTIGNPNLKPTTGNVYDISFEYALPKGGILQLGLFDDEFSNYVVVQTQRLLDTTPGTEFFDVGIPVEFDSFANRSSAYARGIEADYHQQFTFLPGFWKGFGVDGNITLVSSRIQEYDAATSATGHAEFGLLPGTSNLTWNAAGFYEDHGVQLRIAAEYVSHELFSLGGSKVLDTIQDNRLTLDFTSSYEVKKNWQVYFNVKNLTNEPLRFYQNNPSFPIQREFYEQTIEAGVRAKF